MANNLCRDFATALNGTVMSSDNNSCVVMAMRTINTTIRGRATTSPLALGMHFSFEGVDSQGQALNLGEVVMLQREVNPFIDALRENNITVTAVHTHWMFDRPRLMYVHFEAVSAPVTFAQNVADALNTFTSRLDDEE